MVGCKIGDLCDNPIKDDDDIHIVLGNKDEKKIDRIKFTPPKQSNQNISTKVPPENNITNNSFENAQENKPEDEMLLEKYICILSDTCKPIKKTPECNGSEICIQRSEITEAFRELLTRKELKLKVVDKLPENKRHSKVEIAKPLIFDE